jgi:hypothetical protein
MANFQNVTPIKLGQAAMTAAYATLYTTPIKTKTYVKQFDIANTTGGALSVFIHLVPTAGSAGTGNALVFNVTIAANSTLQWKGVQIMDAGDTIQVKASAVGCTITASGGEAV